jgi:hypothetical protein
MSAHNSNTTGSDTEVGITVDIDFSDMLLQFLHQHDIPALVEEVEAAMDKYRSEKKAAKRRAKDEFANMLVM